MYAPPYALRSTTHSRGTVAAAYACTSSAPWRIIPRHSRSLAGLEARRVDEREDRQVEGSRTTARSARALSDASMSSVPARCSGWLATMPTARPSRRASPVTRLGAYRGRSSRKDVVVEHVARSRRARRTTRSGAPAPFRRRRVAVAGRPGRRIAHERRILEVVRRAGTRAAPERGERLVLVVDDERRDAAALLVDRGAAELDAGRRRTPVNAATVSGPLTYANASAVMTTWSTRPSSSAGPETHGPTTTSIVGTTPDASASARATRPHACSDGDALADVGARRRDPRRRPGCRGRSRGARPAPSPPLGGADRAPVLAAVEAEPADGATVDLPCSSTPRAAARRRAATAPTTASLRCAITGVGLA